MALVESNGIEISYESFGRRSDPAVLLVSGFTSQLLGWDEALCGALAKSGLRVIRFDNRDVGLTTKTAGPAPDVVAMFTALMTGKEIAPPPYTLADMAKDGIGLLDALGVRAAHVVGMSMGGMIVQQMAIDHPSRVLSVTSVMSTTGDTAVGKATPAAQQALLRPPSADKEQYLNDSVESSRVISGLLFEEEYRRTRLTLSYERSYYPTGAAFQMAAIASGGDRTEALRKLDVPTLVIHGRADSLVQLSGGEATAAAVPHAQLIVFNDMGHDLPPPLFPAYVDAIGAHVRRVEAAR